jgi:hypothetical protein
VNETSCLYTCVVSSSVISCRRRALLSSLLAFILAVFSNASAEPGPPEVVTKSIDSPAMTVWRIDRPAVNTPGKSYPEIVFKPGDRVTIAAGGCARRGGFPPPNGPAFPYVHSGVDLYVGTIDIPGIVPGATKGKIERFLGTHDIAWDASFQNVWLTLGYEDNDYGDNNYNDIVDIDSGPCKGLGYAWVKIDIEHGGAVPRPDAPPRGQKPMDLVWDALDDNGLPLNPQWQYERDFPNSHPDAGALCDLRTPGMPRCTSQNPTTDSTPNTLTNAGCNMAEGVATNADEWAGHKNWWASTFTGSVALERGYSRYLGATLAVGWDADLDFLMRPKSGSALTLANIQEKGGAFSMEFDGEEVFFDRSHSTFWWSRLYDHENDDQAKELFNPGGKFSGNTYSLPEGKPYNDSVALGLVGLDCRHSCFAELHPVYAVAAHLDASVSDDRWAVFARNWGNEGSCGAQDHQLDLTTITLRIPHKSATAVELLPQSDFRASTSSGTGWNFSNTIHNPGTDDAYALITFNLPAPLQKGVVAGELHLAWSAERVMPEPPRGTTRPAKMTFTRSPPVPTRPAVMTFTPPPPVPTPQAGITTLGLPHGKTPPAGITSSSLAASFPVTDHDELRPTRGDARIDRFIRSLSPANQLAFHANLPYQARESVTLAPDASVTPRKWVHSYPRETHKAFSSPSRFEELSRANRQLCDTLSLSLEWFPDACRTLLRR